MQPNFETDRLFLRQFQLADAKYVQELAGDVEIAKTTLNIPHPYPDGAAEAWIERTREATEKGELYTFAMISNDDGILVGSVGIRVSRNHKHAELGYWVGLPFWGQGFATEAAQRVVQFGFEDLELNRIFAAALTKNPGSYRVMSKVGMKKEGIFKQHVLKWGVFEDLIYFGMTKADYDARDH